MPDLYAIANNFRAALLKRDAEAAGKLVAAFGVAYKRISGELQNLTAAIESARARGELVDASWLFRQQRLAALESQTREHIGKFGGLASELIKTEQARAVQIGAADASRLVQVAVGVNFNRLPTGAVEQMVGFLQDGSPLRDLVHRLGPEAAEKIRDELIAGLALGTGPAAIGVRVREALGGNLTRALAIARTETGRAYTSAAQATYSENADVLAGWVWLSAKSSRTCAVCWAMHGTVHPHSEQFGSHVNCRCVPAPVTHERLETRPGGEAGVREVESGVEAFGRLSADEQREILGPAKYEAFRRGEIELRDLVGHRQDPRWGPIRFQLGLREAKIRALGAQQSTEEAAAVQSLSLPGKPERRQVRGDGFFVHANTKPYVPKGALLGQSTDFSCVPACVRMLVYDLIPGAQSDYRYSESFLRSAFTTTSEGTAVSDVPRILRELRLPVRYLHDSNLDIDDLRQAVERGYALAVVRATSEDVAHLVIVEAISDEWVSIRDPLPEGSGSAYMVRLATFLDAWLLQKSGRGIAVIVVD